MKYQGRLQNRRMFLAFELQQDKNFHERVEKNFYGDTPSICDFWDELEKCANYPFGADTFFEKADGSEELHFGINEELESLPERSGIPREDLFTADFVTETGLHRGRLVYVFSAKSLPKGQIQKLRDEEVLRTETRALERFKIAKVSEVALDAVTTMEVDFSSKFHTCLMLSRERGASTQEDVDRAILNLTTAGEELLRFILTSANADAYFDVIEKILGAYVMLSSTSSLMSKSRFRDAITALFDVNLSRFKDAADASQSWLSISSYYAFALDMDRSMTNLSIGKFRHCGNENSDYHQKRFYLFTCFQESSDPELREKAFSDFHNSAKAFNTALKQYWFNCDFRRGFMEDTFYFYHFCSCSGYPSRSEAVEYFLDLFEPVAVEKSASDKV